MTGSKMSTTISDKELAGGEAAAQSGYVWCLTDEQKEALAQFRQNMRDRIDEHWNGELTAKEKEFLDSDVDMLRFLRSRYEAGAGKEL